MLQQQWQEAQTASTDWIAALGAQPDDSDETEELPETPHSDLRHGHESCRPCLGDVRLRLYDSLIATIPAYGYALLTVVNVFWFARSRNFNRFRFIQLALSLLLPFLMMIALGGFVRGSATNSLVNDCAVGCAPCDQPAPGCLLVRCVCRTSFSERNARTLRQHASTRGSHGADDLLCHEYSWAMDGSIRDPE